MEEESKLLIPENSGNSAYDSGMISTDHTNEQTEKTSFFESKS